MGEVGGSRHYGGAGLGAIGVWICPACNAENVGPIGACSQCGSGQGARKVAPMEEPPIDGVAEQGDVADAWVRRHPQGTPVEAYRAGFLDGVRAARAAAADERQQLSSVPPPPREELPMTPAGKLDRTLVAALELFRDQVLAGHPEEVASGEWMSAAEVTTFVTHLRESRGIEHAHA